MGSPCSLRRHTVPGNARARHAIWDFGITQALQPGRHGPPLRSVSLAKSDSVGTARRACPLCTARCTVRCSAHTHALEPWSLGALEPWSPFCAGPPTLPSAGPAKGDRRPRAGAGAPALHTVALSLHCCTASKAHLDIFRLLAAPPACPHHCPEPAVLVLSLLLAGRSCMFVQVRRPPKLQPRYFPSRFRASSLWSPATPFTTAPHLRLHLLHASSQTHPSTSAIREVPTRGMGRSWSGPPPSASSPLPTYRLAIRPSA